ncbi:MAG: site-specific integrase [Ruminococcus sp.]|nr:site-specific integrase [Ruminococcus sp.]
MSEMANRRKNGAGTLRKRADGRWEARVVVGYDENGYPKTKNVTSKSKAECQRKLNELKEQFESASNKCKSEMSFSDWLNFWFENYSKPALRESTKDFYRNLIYNYIIPEIGNVQLDKLKSSDLQQFYSKLKTSGRKTRTELFGEGLSDRMVRSCHTTLKSALHKAVDEGLIRSNPAIGCKLPPKKAKEMQVLTNEEIQRFLIQAKEDGFYEFFLLELATGMRRGEILGLQWTDLNFKTGELHITRQASVVNGKLNISVPKTKTSDRIIILPKVLLDMLSEYKKSVNSKWLFPSPKNDDVPRNPVSMGKSLKKILERAECKNIRFHDLRHTFATMALENGMDVKTLSAMIGHVSAATTLDVYSHLTDKMQIQASINIDRKIGGTDAKMPEEKTPDQDTEKPPQPKFEPKKGKIRKSGTGCIYQVSENVWEGSYSPRLPNGKRKKFNIYAPTKEECEVKLKELIENVKAQIKAEKEKQG